MSLKIFALILVGGISAHVHADVLLCSIHFSGKNSYENRCHLQEIVLKEVREHPGDPGEKYDYAKIEFAVADIQVKVDLNFGKLMTWIIQAPSNIVYFETGQSGVKFPATYKSQVQLDPRAAAEGPEYLYLECAIRNPNRDGVDLPSCR